MAVYRYNATEHASGKRQRGELTADSAYQVRAALRQMGLLAEDVRELGGNPKSAQSFALTPWLSERLRRLGRHHRSPQLVDLYEDLASMLAAGAPIVEALETLASGAGGKAKRAQRPTSTLCRVLADGLRHGTSLADAMAERADWFEPVDVALVRAAQQSGGLEHTLHDLAEHHGRRDALSSRLATALAYPALLLTFGLGVVVFLTTVTLPKLAQVLQDAEVALPTATGALLWFGGFIVERWAIALLVLALLIIGIAWTLRSPTLAQLRLRVPLLGRIALRSQLASYSQLVARLLRAGIPLTEALALARDGLSNPALRAAFDDLTEALRAGRSAAGHLASSSLFEPVYIRVIEIGEQSGELAEVLETIGARYRASADRMITRLSTLLEPAVILVIAALIGFVVYAAIAPMLRLAQTL